MRRKISKSVNDTIAQLYYGEIDKPISIEGTLYERRLLQQLEVLRISMRDARDKQAAVSEKHKVALASVVHDLKTPLAVISGYAESLEDGMDDKPYLTLILKKTEEMNNQVISLVESSRQEAQELASRKEDIKVLDFFTEEIDRYKKLAKEKHLRLIVGHIANVTLYGNRTQLKRLIQNLISNAIKYTPYGGRVKVTVRKVSHEIRFSVADNGIGIARENIENVFDKFFREDKSRGSQGSGLGLYITKEIVEQHNGEITVKSKKGRGSKFVVRLPIESGGEVKKSLTARFDACPHEVKMLLFFILGWILPCMYRFQKYYETRRKSTLSAAILLIPLFLLGWLTDLISIGISDKITFLAD